MEKIIKKLMKNIIGGIVIIGLILGIFYIIGLFEQLVLNHMWLLIPLAIIVLILLIKEIYKGDE